MSEAKPDSTVLLSADEAERERIVKGWRKAIETYLPGELTIEERHQFERASLIERQMKEKSFILP